jgi:hypothetical protein
MFEIIGNAILAIRWNWTYVDVTRVDIKLVCYSRTSYDETGNIDNSLS